jgi:hypothetical protein
MSPTITSEAFDFLARRAGYTLSPEQKAELISVYPHIAAMIARVHAPRGREAEPAHIFVPGETVAA